MATWVEDIIQALNNLGGQAHRKDILGEIRRIRNEPLPLHAMESMQERIQAHSSDSAHFQGKDLFKKVGNGVWALRDQVIEGTKQAEQAKRVRQSRALFSERKETGMTTWVEAIVQALKNLGGQATNAQICEEVKRIKEGPFPKSWASMINHIIGEHSSDSVLYRGGSNLFKKIDKGVWALREYDGSAIPKRRTPLPPRRQVTYQNFLPPESLEEITNTLHTIKEYKTFYSQDNASRKEFIKELFHIMGFSTGEVNSKLYLLEEIGAYQEPLAMLVILNPEDQIDSIPYNSELDLYVYSISLDYKTKYVIVTNGFQLHVLNYDVEDEFQPIFWNNIDQIFDNDQEDQFFVFYKLLSYLKHSRISILPKRKTRNLSSNERWQELEKIRKDFFRQLFKELTNRKYIAITKARLEEGNKLILHVMDVMMRGVYLSFVIRTHSALVALEISGGTKEQNKRVFYEFYQKKEEYESALDQALNWQLLPDRKQSRIECLVSQYGLFDREHWNETQEKLIEKGRDFYDVFLSIFSL